MLTEFAQERVELAEKALKKKVKRATQPEHPGYGALHEVRIAGKKLRYLLEFFSPVLASSDQPDARAGGAPHKFNRFSHLSRLLENCPQACKQILWTTWWPCPSGSTMDAEGRLSEKRYCLYRLDTPQFANRPHTVDRTGGGDASDHARHNCIGGGVMKPFDATSRVRAAVVLLALSTALSGCYYYVPYAYVPYSAVPTTETQQWPFTMPDAAASDAAVSTYAYSALAAPVFVEPAYYPVAYPYYGWPAWWGPSVSLGFGYWGGCCYGWGGHG